MASSDPEGVRAELKALGFERTGGIELEGIGLRNVRKDEIYEHSSHSCVALFRPTAGADRTVLRLESHLSDGTVIQTVLDDWLVRLTLGPFSSLYDPHLKMKVVSFIGKSVRDLSTAHVREMQALARARKLTPRETRAESIGYRIERSASTVAMASVLRQIAWLVAFACGAATPFVCAMLAGFPLAAVPLFIPVAIVAIFLVFFAIGWLVPVVVRSTSIESRRVFGEPSLSRLVMPTRRPEALYDDRPPLSRRFSEFTSSMRRIGRRSGKK